MDQPTVIVDSGATYMDAYKLAELIELFVLDHDQYNEFNFLRAAHVLRMQADEITALIKQVKNV